jgi:hypothetical protein
MFAPSRMSDGPIDEQLLTTVGNFTRAHRARSAPAPGPKIALAYGNRASAGELIITRRNDRRLRSSASGWVKNGDRWTVLTADRDGGLRVQHGRSGRTIQLPASYVRDSVVGLRHHKFTPLRGSPQTPCTA